MQDQQSMSRHTRYRCFLTVLISLLSGAWVSTALGAAGLSDAVVRWNMQTVDDSNGGNSQLSVVDNGDATLIGTGVFDILFWGNEGEGSDGWFANQRTGTSRIGTYFDAGQGTNDELQITGAHTILWRGEVKDASITGYFWSKYDHQVGPNALKNRGAYLRYEPGGSLSYVIDDGDGGLPATSVSLPAGTVGTGGEKFEITTVFDPLSDTASLYVLNPKTRSVLTSATSAVTFDAVDMATPVPFTMGDRLTWSGSAWQSIGGSGARVDVEMFVVWDRAYTEQDIVDLAEVAPAEPVSFTEITEDPAILLEFSSEAGEDYRLEFTTSPTNTDWQWTGFSIRGDGGTRHAFDPAGIDTQKTYRIIPF